MSCKQKSQPICCRDFFDEEPLRIFFPLGLLMGIFAVLLWPLFYLDLLNFYPSIAHARLMIQGFIGAFTIGFLSMEAPRMLNTKRIKKTETFIMLALFIAKCLFHLTGNVEKGDFIFFLLLLFFGNSLFSRVLLFRKGVPPPGFVFVGLGYLCAIIGTAILNMAWYFTLPTLFTKVGSLLLYQCWLLFSIIGMGPVLFARTNGKHNLQVYPASQEPSQGWWPKALFNLAIGTSLLICYVLQASDINGLTQLAAALRVVILTSYFYHTKIFSFIFPIRFSNTLATCLNFGLLSLLIGSIFSVFLPTYRIALDHAFYVGGLSFIIFIVATRVVLEHRGLGEHLLRPLPIVWIIAALVITALATRISADFFPQIHRSHIIYAAILWALGALIWAIYVAPYSLKKKIDK